MTWFNSPIYDGGYRFPITGGLVPSISGTITSIVNAGVPPGKLGVGIPFNGYIWNGGDGMTNGGATLPRQSWTIAPTTSRATYKGIVSNYFQSAFYHWDDAAQAAYLSIDNSGSSQDRFISYEDGRSCQAKVSYARNAGLGGVMIFELSEDYVPGQPAPLLQAIKQALLSPGTMSIQVSGQNVTLSFTSMPLGSYRVQWSSNSTTDVWHTLITTNIANAGGQLRVIDTGVLNKFQRFYRVQTPSSP